MEGELFASEPGQMEAPAQGIESKKGEELPAPPDWVSKSGPEETPTKPQGIGKSARPETPSGWKPSALPKQFSLTGPVEDLSGADIVAAGPLQ